MWAFASCEKAHLLQKWRKRIKGRRRWIKRRRRRVWRRKDAIEWKMRVRLKQCICCDIRRDRATANYCWRWKAIARLQYWNWRKDWAHWSKAWRERRRNWVVWWKWTCLFPEWTICRAVEQRSVRTLSTMLMGTRVIVGRAGQHWRIRSGMRCCSGRWNCAGERRNWLCGSSRSHSESWICCGARVQLWSCRWGILSVSRQRRGMRCQRSI